jgi:hypothetical protein
MRNLVDEEIEKEIKRNSKRRQVQQNDEEDGELQDGEENETIDKNKKKYSAIEKELNRKAI